MGVRAAAPICPSGEARPGFQDQLVADLDVAIDGAEDVRVGVVAPHADRDGTGHGVAMRLVVRVGAIVWLVVAVAIAVAITGFGLRSEKRPDRAAAERRIFLNIGVTSSW